MRAYVWPWLVCTYIPSRDSHIEKVGDACHLAYGTINQEFWSHWECSWQNNQLPKYLSGCTLRSNNKNSSFSRFYAWFPIGGLLVHVRADSLPEWLLVIKPTLFKVCGIFMGQIELVPHPDWSHLGGLIQIFWWASTTFSYECLPSQADMWPAVPRVLSQGRGERNLVMSCCVMKNFHERCCKYTYLLLQFFWNLTLFFQHV